MCASNSVSFNFKKPFDGLSELQIFISSSLILSENNKRTFTNTNHTKDFYHPAERPGYSGVAVWVKSKDKNKIIKKGMKGFTDKEGRVLSVDIDKNITLVSVYVPNGGKSEEAYKEKLKFYKLLTAHNKNFGEK